VKIIFHKGLYMCRPPTEFIQPLLKNKWAYHKASNTWRTSQARRVIPFYEYCAPQAKERVGKLIKKKQEALKPSVMEELDFDFSVPMPEKEECAPFQLAGVHFMAQRPVTLLGDPPGLGKTIQAIALANFDGAKRVLIVCPASLKGMWEKAWKRFSTLGLSVGIAEGDDLPDTDVVIINYDIIARHKDVLKKVDWTHFFIDEGHYLQNPESQRTQAVLGDTSKSSTWMERSRSQGISAHRVVWMTGTPVKKCPHNLWPFLARFDPNGLGKNYWSFISRYCDWSRGETLPPTGGSNLDELQEYLRSKFMIRRNKKTVLKELPDKRHQIIELPAKGLKKLVEAEYNAVAEALGNLEALIDSNYIEPFDEDDEDEDDYDTILAALKQAKEMSGDSFATQANHLETGERTAFQDMAAARKELALAKLPMCIEFIKNVMDGSDEKTIVFAFHKDVVTELEKAFPNSVTITGKTKVKDRQPIVDLFQEDETRDPFIGNISAAGTGLTLTAATNVIFVELSWLPSDLEQAEDRAHRMGQLNAVNVWHLVVAGSTDARMVEKLVERQAMIAELMDRPENDLLAIEVD
jgi:SWI/SNF-related matrix-associated actin-dependent regulator 1 of chromatin subfamily A